MSVPVRSGGEGQNPVTNRARQVGRKESESALAMVSMVGSEMKLFSHQRNELPLDE